MQNEHILKRWGHCTVKVVTIAGITALRSARLAQARHGDLSAPNDRAVAESAAARVRRDTSTRSISTRRERLRISKRKAVHSSEDWRINFLNLTVRDGNLDKVVDYCY